MSVYSEAWHNTPPAVRDFYRNYHRRYLAHGWKAEYDPIFHVWYSFYGAGWEFRGFSGYAIAQSNWSSQLWYLGSYDVARVYFELDPFWPPPPIQPSGPGVFPGAYPDQFVEIPDWADNYPRPKYKVRRQYWTGKPIHRRNL